MQLFGIALGGLGILGTGILFPLLAIPLHHARSRLHRPRGDSTLPTFDILIAAHNEEALLDATLSSIRAAVEALRAEGVTAAVTTCVGADDCSDRTAEIAMSHGARVIPCAYRSKWRTLRRLNSMSRASWCLFADAGVVWPRGFLTSLYSSMKRGDLVGIAPAYYLDSGRLWEKWHWRVERSLKALESLAGGPISIHGATVAYRRDALVRAFDELGDKQWYNDDVVLPWTIRMQNPGRSILYWRGTGKHDRLVDKGVAATKPEYPRRRRMAIGNLQWASLFAKDFRRDPVVALIGLRRAFRLLWAYWLLILGLGIVAAFFSPPAIVLGLFGLAVGSRLGAIKCLISSATASLLVPYYLVARKVEGEAVVWG